MMKRMIGALLAVLALTAPHVRAQTALPASLREVGFVQRLNEQVPLDLDFRNETGRVVKVAEYFRGKPVILVLAYYRCPMLCTEVLNGLARGLLDIPFDAGKEFQVVIVSFDPRETAELAAAKKKSYVERYGRPGAKNGWHFLTGDEASIKRLTEAVGFRYHYDARNDQFAHASGIMILTPAGRISRYFYDIRFPSRDLRLGLVEASENRIGSPVDQILLYCFHYDPAEGRYGPVIMNFVRAGGVMTMLGVGSLIGLLWRAERRRNGATVSAFNGTAKN
jgi:protein SCO1/2